MKLTKQLFIAFITVYIVCLYACNNDNHQTAKNDSLAIRAKIYDGYVDITRGLLDFTPFVNCDSSAITALPPINCPTVPLAIEETVSNKNPGI